LQLDHGVLWDAALILEGAKLVGRDLVVYDFSSTIGSGVSED
jgi:hypothetical protein